MHTGHMHAGMESQYCIPRDQYQNIATLLNYILNQKCMRKASVGMYSGYDMLSLRILFVYFFGTAAIPTSSFDFIQLFFILVIILCTASGYNLGQYKRGGFLFCFLLGKWNALTEAYRAEPCPKTLARYMTNYACEHRLASYLLATSGASDPAKITRSAISAIIVRCA